MLVPIEKADRECEVFRILHEKGLLIDIDNIEKYLSVVKRRKSTRPNPSYWDNKRVLLTGISGFVGSHLAEEALKLGAEVYGIVRRHAVSVHPNIEHIRDETIFLEGDLTEQGRVEEIIRKTSPNVICHYAAESFVPTSLAEPSRVMFNNACGTINVLEGARKCCKELEAIWVACSSEQYGYVKSLDELPIKESNPFRPCSVYAVSKVCTDYISRVYNINYGLPVVISRTFNTEGPRRGLQFFTSVIARQVARCLQMGEGEVVMGNPNSVRDFTHVHDIVNAHMLAVEKAEAGDPHNTCSGFGIRTGGYAKLALRLFDLEDKVNMLVDTERIRPYEEGEALIDGFIGDYEKFNAITGWNPTLSIIDIIRDGVKFFRGHPEYLNYPA